MARGAAALAGRCALALRLRVRGCSFSYQLDSLFAKKDEAGADRVAAPPTPKPRSPSRRPKATSPSPAPP